MSQLIRRLRIASTALLTISVCLTIVFVAVGSTTVGPNYHLASATEGTAHTYVGLQSITFCTDYYGPEHCSLSIPLPSPEYSSSDWQCTMPVGQWSIAAQYIIAVFTFWPLLMLISNIKLSLKVKTISSIACAIVALIFELSALIVYATRCIFVDLGSRAVVTGKMGGAYVFQIIIFALLIAATVCLTMFYRKGGVPNQVVASENAVPLIGAPLLAQHVPIHLQQEGVPNMPYYPASMGRTLNDAGNV